MEPLLLALAISFFVKNVAQDAAFAVRGKDPPSARRQAARAQSLGKMTGRNRSSRKPLTGRREGRRFFANAWHDAWETASERRSHVRARRAESRRAKWAAADEAQRGDGPSDWGRPAEADPPQTGGGDNQPEQEAKPSGSDDTDAAARADSRPWGQPRPDLVPDSARNPQPISEGGPAPGTPPDAPVEDASVLGLPMQPTCSRCGQGVTRIQRLASGEVLCPGCYAALPRCVDCGQRTDSAYSRPLDGTLCYACVSAWMGRRAAERDTRSGEEPPQTEGNGNENSDAHAPVNGKDHNTVSSPNSEVLGPQSAMQFSEDMADALEQNHTLTETAVSSLEAHDVSSQAVASFRDAMESLKVCVDKFREAAKDMEQQVQIQEQYQANPGAGDKEFMLSE